MILIKLIILYETLHDELFYFEKREKKQNYIETVGKLQDNDLYQFDKQDILIRHMIRVWVNQEQEDFYFRILDEYFNNDERLATNQLRRIVQEYGYKRAKIIKD